MHAITFYFENNVDWGKVNIIGHLKNVKTGMKVWTTLKK